MILDWNRNNLTGLQGINNPNLPDFYISDKDKINKGGKLSRAGFTVELQLKNENITEQILLDSRDKWSKGWSLKLKEDMSLEFGMSDGRTSSIWTGDPGQIKEGCEQFVTVIVDGGPNLIMFIVDGLLNDGDKYKQFGWGSFNPYMQSINNYSELQVSESVTSLKVFDRAMTITESIGNFQFRKNLNGIHYSGN